MNDSVLLPRKQGMLDDRGLFFVQILHILSVGLRSTEFHGLRFLQ